MNRRDFTRSILAAATLPLVPTPALAATSVPIALPSAATSWASYLSAMHGTCTPNMLSKVLSVDVSAAQHITQELVSRGVITSTQTIGTISQTRTVAKQGPKSLKNLRSKLKTLVETQDPIDQVSTQDDDAADRL